MSEPLDFKPVVVTSRSGDTRTISSIQKAKVFLDATRDLYTSFASASSSAHRRLSTYLNRLDEAIATFQNESTVDTYANLSNRLIQIGTVIWFADEPKGRLLRQLAQQSSDIAVGTYMMWLNIESEKPASPERVKGGVMAVLFDLGLLGEHGSSHLAIENAAKQFADWSEKAKAEAQGFLMQLQLVQSDWLESEKSIRSSAQEIIDQAGDTVGRLSDTASEQLASYGKSFTAALERNAEAVEERIKHYDTELNTIRVTYDAHLATKAPSSYWTDKAKTHRNIAWAFSGAFALMVGAVVALILWYANHYLVPLDAQQAQVAAERQEGLSFWTDASGITRVSVFAALLAIAFWVLKILARNMISHIHLATDARERSIMIVTYLSLLRKGKLKEEELKTVLAAIFRPSADGMVKEDGPTPVLFEMFRKQ